jgi:hypothetical protein
MENIDAYPSITKYLLKSMPEENKVQSTDDLGDFLSGISAPPPQQTMDHENVNNLSKQIYNMKTIKINETKNASNTIPKKNYTKDNEYKTQEASSLFPSPVYKNQPSNNDSMNTSRGYSQSHPPSHPQSHPPSQQIPDMQMALKHIGTLEQKMLGLEFERDNLRSVIIQMKEQINQQHITSQKYNEHYMSIKKQETSVDTNDLEDYIYDWNKIENRKK